MTRLIINADDFGLHPSVNHAIANCFQFGSVNSTSVIANGRALNTELLLQLHGTGLQVGAHITWVNEPWLTQNTYIHSWRELLKRIAFGGTTFVSLMKHEAEAQVALLMQYNIQLSHIDSHQHVHHLPFLWQILQSIQLKHYIPRIRIARVCHKSLVRKTVTGYLLNYMAGCINRCPEYYCAGIKYAGNYTLPLLTEEILLSKQMNTELIVHPGTNNAELNKLYHYWGFNWEAEYKALMQPEFLMLLKKTV
jgi:predicted glycoside hydrolase/deacetylase ChbG (UPF0249 family)